MTIISAAERGMSRRAALILLGTATTFAIPVVRYLSQLDSGEISQEREADDSKTERNKSQTNIAIVDDHPEDTLSRFIRMNVLGANISYYSTCQPLLLDLESGKRYNMYLVDYNPGDTNGLWGDVCTSEILKLHPGASVIGLSMDEAGENFRDAGAREFFNRNLGDDVISRAIKDLLR